MSSKRILLKISGEALAGASAYGIDGESVRALAKRLVELHKKGHEIGVVLGGGNIFRGIQGSKLEIERNAADHMGMLATIMNGIVLQQFLSQEGAKAYVMSAIECPAVAKRYHSEEALEHLAQGRIVVFVGGSGHPYFTTDTAAALRACEIKADILLKATTRVDGVYCQDPLKSSHATKYDKISYTEFVEKKLGVLDLTAVTLCMSNQIPIRVFNLYKGSLLDAISKDTVLGTLIK